MGVTMRIVFILLFLSLKFFAQVSSLENIRKLSESEKHKEVIALSTTELKKLKTTDSLYERIMHLRVFSFMMLSDFKSAISDYKILAGIDPTNINNYNGLAYAYWGINDYLNCLTSIHKAYDLNKKSIITLSNMVYYYNESGKFKEAIDYANKGLSEHPNVKERALLLNNRGYSRVSLKDYQQGLTDINESLTLFPDNSFAYYYRALANIGLHKTETVCEDLKKCKDLGGGNLVAELMPKHCTLKEK